MTTPRAGGGRFVFDRRPQVDQSTRWPAGHHRRHPYRLRRRLSVTEPDNPYARGHDAGEISARLAGHDRQFTRINTSITDLLIEMRTVSLAVQRLGDQAMAREATVLTTAAALKDNEEARRDKSEQTWSPWSRMFAVLAAIATAAGLYALLKPH